MKAYQSVDNYKLMKNKKISFENNFMNNSNSTNNNMNNSKK